MKVEISKHTHSPHTQTIVSVQFEAMESSTSSESYLFKYLFKKTNNIVLLTYQDYFQHQIKHSQYIPNKINYPRFQ